MANPAASPVVATRNRTVVLRQAGPLIVGRSGAHLRQSTTEFDRSERDQTRSGELTPMAVFVAVGERRTDIAFAAGAIDLVGAERSVRWGDATGRGL